MMFSELDPDLALKIELMEVLSIIILFNSIEYYRANKGEKSTKKNQNIGHWWTVRLQRCVQLE